MSDTHISAQLWAPEAEHAAIGCVLIDNRSFDRANLPAEAFFDGRHRVIWQAIERLTAARKPADIITVFEFLRASGEAENAGGLTYLQELGQCVASARSVQAYAEAIRDKAAQRSLRAALIEGLQAIDGEGSATDKIAAVTASLSAMQRSTVRSAPRALSEIMMGRTEHYENLSSGKHSSGIKTGIQALDAALGGGLKPGKLVIVAARPGVGKSSLSQQFAIRSAEDGHPVLFLSQEMEAEELADRGVANMGRVNFSATQTGRFNDGDWARVVDAVEAVQRLPIYVDDQPSLRLSDIRAKAQVVPGIKLLIVDYLQLCASTRKDGNRNNEIEEISRGLKEIAKTLHIPVIALSQLSRDVERRTNGEPVLSDLRDSGAIEQDADAVIFLWRIRDDGDSALIGCKLDKNRGGLKARFGLHFEGAVQRWGQSSEPLYQPAIKAKRDYAAEGIDA